MPFVCFAKVVSVGRFKFFKEAQVVFREHAQIAYLIFQISDAFDSHTESISCVYFAVDTTLLQNIRVDHSAS